MPTERTRRFLQARAAGRRLLQEAARDVRERQDATLRELLAGHAATQFGIDHDFARIRSFDEFRRAVPIRDYDGLAPWLSRQAAGEANVIVTERPMAYRRTSGTGGSPKEIPVTPRSWSYEVDPLRLAYGQAADRWPGIFDRPTSVLSVIQNPRGRWSATRDGTVLQHYSEQCAANTNQGQALEGLPGSETPWYDSGQPLSPVDLTYFRLRFALEADLLGIHSILPSSLIFLQQQLVAQLPRLVRDLHDGTFGGNPHWSAKPNPARARELERLASPTLRDVWPNLRYALVWKTGPSKYYLPLLQDQIGHDLPILPFLYCASEGVIATHLDDHETSGFLIPHGVVYEFIPADRAVEAHSETLRLHELEAGQSYHLVHSAWNGLARYTIGDVVHVDEMVDGVPRAHYEGRGDSTSNFMGERLNERQVADALAAALAKLGRRASNFTCCPRWGTPPAYVYVVELADGAADAAALGAEVERQMVAGSWGYAHWRSIFTLGPAEVALVAPGTFGDHKNRVVATGKGTVAALKDKLLQKDARILPELLDISAQREAR